MDQGNEKREPTTKPVLAHEVTNNASDRSQLSAIALAARDAMGKRRLKAIADMP